MCLLERITLRFACPASLHHAAFSMTLAHNTFICSTPRERAAPLCVVTCDNVAVRNTESDCPALASSPYSITRSLWAYHTTSAGCEKYIWNTLGCFPDSFWYRAAGRRSGHESAITHPKIHLFGDIGPYDRVKVSLRISTEDAFAAE